MKTNTLHFVSFVCTSFAIALVIIGTMGTAKAQNTLPNLNQSVLNGLFSPTAAERFFEEGRQNMEGEVQILANPELHKGEDILQINTVDIQTIKETEEKKPSFNVPEESLQKELD